MLELMFVLIIIGIITSVVAYNYGGFTNDAKRTATVQNLEKIKASLLMYDGRYSMLPPTLDGLIPEFLDKKRVRDGWGSELRYEPGGFSPEQPFVLISPGQDKRFGTADDIDIWAVQN